jgi:uncharacterized protein (TIGR00156 family)
MEHSLPLLSLNSFFVKSLSVGALSLCALSLAGNADAQSGGFAGPDNLRLVTVAEALELPDDTDVKLQGYIVKALGDENYEFRDDSGTIVVEIDDDEWHGLEVTPDLHIELSGEIEKDWNGTELEVDTLRKL